MTTLVGQLRHEDVTVVRPVSVRLPVYIDVSRPVQPWRWRHVVVAPLEIVALAWSVPLAILAVMVPIGLAVAGLLRLGRQVVSWL